MLHSARLRGGSVILEPLVALLVVTVTGLTLLVSLSELRNVSAAYRRRHDELLAASEFLDRVALWPAADLDRRLGDRPQGPYTLRVRRTQANLYDLMLLNAETGAMLLSTAVHRPVATGDTRAP